MKKHIILGFKNNHLNEKLEAERKDFVSDYTLRSLSELKQIKKYFNVSSVAISGDLKHDPDLVDTLIKFRKDPETESVNIVLFVGRVIFSDVEVIKKVGQLIDNGIYPILLAPAYNLVTRFLNDAPSMTKALQILYNKYTELKEEKETHHNSESESEELPRDDFKLKPAKIIGFAEGKPNDGKKFILSNFVVTLAKNNPDKKIAILDFDNSDSYLRDNLGIDEDDSRLGYLIKSLRSYTTQSRLKDADSNADKEKLNNRLDNAINKALVPVSGMNNVFAITHTEKDSDKIMDLTASDIETLLNIIKKNNDIVIFNLTYDLINKKGLANIWKQVDLVYSVITMDKRDIKSNLKLKQKYADNNIFEKTHYILNKYEDKNYNEELDRQTNTKLAFDKDLLNMYGFEVTNIIPYIEPNILYNESFTGVLLANETTKETKYPRTAFELVVKDSGHAVPALD